MLQETDTRVELEEVTIESNTKDLEVPQTEIKTFEQTQAEIKQLKYDNYCINFKDRIEAWKASHTDKGGNCPPPPIQYDTDYGDWVWVNREMRRG